MTQDQPWLLTHIVQDDDVIGFLKKLHLMSDQDDNSVSQELTNASTEGKKVQQLIDVDSKMLIQRFTNSTFPT